LPDTGQEGVVQAAGWVGHGGALSWSEPAADVYPRHPGRRLGGGGELQRAPLGAGEQSRRGVE